MIHPLNSFSDCYFYSLYYSNLLIEPNTIARMKRVIVPCCGITLPGLLSGDSDLFEAHQATFFLSNKRKTGHVPAILSFLFLPFIYCCDAVFQAVLRCAIGRRLSIANTNLP